jgi:hypothetical protein
MAPQRHRTFLTAVLLVVPIVAGGFLLQEPPARAHARVLEPVGAHVTGR